MSDSKSTNSKSEFRKRRERLFWNGKPTIRPATLDDRKWLKLAAQMVNKEVTDEQFQEYLELFSQYQETWIVEDRNDKFGGGSGPVCVVACMNNGWMLLPHVDWFPWATKKNKIRCQVAFLHRARFRKEIGVIRLHVPPDAADFFRGIKKYIPVFELGYIPMGDELGRWDDHIFFMKGKGQYKD